MGGMRIYADFASEASYQASVMVDALEAVGVDVDWRAVGPPEAAVSGYAEAYGAGVGCDVRRVLFAAYRLDHLDIGNPEVLRKLLAGPIRRGHSPSMPLRDSGYAVSMSGAPITVEAWRRIQAWNREWDRRGALTLIEEGEPVLRGEDALRRLEKEMIRTGAILNPSRPDPARYPRVAVRPPMEWVSWVGGPWAEAWMRG
jgi:hypothetical protein